MKRLIFRYWLGNVLISLALFIAYRIVIAASNESDAGFLGNVLQIIEAFLNVAYSLIYLLAIAFCSLTIFLNHIDKIRSRFYLSALTFLGIPLSCISFIIVNGLIDQRLYRTSIISNLLFFSIIYLLATTLQFLSFRKKIKNSNSIIV